MELKGKIEAQFSLTPEEAASVLQAMVNANRGLPVMPVMPVDSRLKLTPCEPVMAEQTPAPAPAAQPEQPKEEPAPAPVKTAPHPQPVATPQPAPAPEYKETPEQAVAYLKEHFGIKPNKEDRTPEEQKKAVALFRAITALVRDITRDGSAQSLADLKCDLNRQEFIKRSMGLSYDVGSNQFKELPF